MKKFGRKLLVVLFCIAMIGACGSDENTESTEQIQQEAVAEEEEYESVERTITDIQESETDEEATKENKEELVVLEDDEAIAIEDEDENLMEEEAVQTEEVLVEESIKIQEPEYTYSDLNQTMYASQAVNVRSLPGTEGEKLGGLSYAQEVTVTGQCNESGWYRIQYDGGEAFVSNQYLVSGKPVQTQSSSSSSETSGGGETGNSVTVPTHEDTVGNLVWVPTKGGKKYHSKATCSGMEDPMQVTVEHAKSLGYDACKRCY